MYCFISNDYFKKIVIAEKLKNATNVPITPNKRIFDRLAKKSPLCILKPDAKTIGGKIKKKNMLPSNLSRSIISLLPYEYSMYDMSMPILDNIFNYFNIII